ncbi:flavin reductase family protein [Pseudomonas sp. NPDC087697]|uniref:flavin reductase family protein n=1 Tax=Pseudomonas sp. NPDC087697 TaxID=3364447 RepID=UPI0038182860
MNGSVRFQQDKVSTLSQPTPTADPAQFIAAMGQCATGVTVITTDGSGGRFGVTVSAMTSVSAEPPMLLVCVNRSNLASKAIDLNGCFCVNVIETEQRPVAQVFAGQIKLENADRFTCADWTPHTTGAPLLDNALASFDCEIAHQMDLGTHTVYVGKVVAVKSREGAPLAYSQRKFCGLQALEGL